MIEPIPYEYNADQMTEDSGWYFAACHYPRRFYSYVPGVNYVSDTERQQLRNSERS